MSTLIFANRRVTNELMNAESRIISYTKDFKSSKTVKLRILKKLRQQYKNFYLFCKVQQIQYHPNRVLTKLYITTLSSNMLQNSSLRRHDGTSHPTTPKQPFNAHESGNQLYSKLTTTRRDDEDQETLRTPRQLLMQQVEHNVHRYTNTTPRMTSVLTEGEHNATISITSSKLNSDLDIQIKYTTADQ